MPLWGALANDTTKTIVVLGDSLVAGYGLKPGESFPEQLETALKPTFPNVRIVNAGVSGDTTAGGRARIEGVLAQHPEIAIVVLGGNDLLRGLPVEETQKNLEAIVKTLTEHHIYIILAGMVAPPNYGQEYANKFNPVYPNLAKKYHTGLYPFFLEGVYGNAKLSLPDGMHPNKRGVGRIVEKFAPLVADLLK